MDGDPRRHAPGTEVVRCHVHLVTTVGQRLGQTQDPDWGAAWYGERASGHHGDTQRLGRRGLGHER
jgi:hypothetical protein